MISVAVDPGTLKLGICLFENQRLIDIRQIECGNKLILEQRFQQINQVMLRTITSWDIPVVDNLFVETPFFGRNVSTAIKLATVRGIIISCFLTKYYGIKVVNISPAEVRAFYNKISKVEKKEYQSIILEKYGEHLSGVGEDAIDSIGILEAGLKKLEKIQTNGQHSGQPRRNKTRR